MSVEDPGFWLAVLQIIWIDVLLSGDNAVVIALACRKLPPRQRMWGIVLGTLVAISLRVIFTGMVTQLMTMPYVKLVGGVLLFWIAVKLLGGEENEKEIEAVDSLWKAIKIVAIADVVMSLDNIIAVAAAARGSYALLMFGLAVSIPLIMAGAAIVIALLERFPVIVWAGAALLGLDRGRDHRRRSALHPAPRSGHGPQRPPRCGDGGRAARPAYRRGTAPPEPAERARSRLNSTREGLRRLGGRKDRGRLKKNYRRIRDGCLPLTS